MTVDEKRIADYHVKCIVEKNLSIDVTGKEAIMGTRKAKTQKPRQSTAKIFQTFFADALDLAVSAYMFLILAVLPFYNQEGYAHIGTDKSYFFRQCSLKSAFVILPLLVLYFTASGIVFAQEKQRHPLDIKKWLKEHFSVTDWCALAFGITVVVSYACSAYKDEALIGTAGWYMGTGPQLALVASYFLISRSWRLERRLALCVLPVSATVFLLGILNMFDIYPIAMNAKTIGFISTIGNINWYCGYLTTVFFGGLVLFWQMGAKQWKLRIPLAAYVFLGFTSLVTQDSSSGLLTLVIILLVLFYLSAEDGMRMQAFWESALLLSAGCLICWIVQLTGMRKIVRAGTEFAFLHSSPFAALMTCVSLFALLYVTSANRKGKYPAAIFRKLAKTLVYGGIGALALFAVLLTANTLSGGQISQMLGLPANNILMFSARWGSSRGATWGIAWGCFWQFDFVHKLIGAGPDCMSAFLYQGASEELRQWTLGIFGNSRLTNAHNEWLTILVNEGLLGLVSFAGMMCSAILRFLKERKISIVAGACGFCALAYTVNNIFSFQQSMNITTLFILLGIGENFLREKALNKS